MQIEIETCKRTSIQKQRAENQTTKKKKKILRSPRRYGSPRVRGEGGWKYGKKLGADACWRWKIRQHGWHHKREKCNYHNPRATSAQEAVRILTLNKTAALVRRHRSVPNCWWRLRVRDSHPLKLPLTVIDLKHLLGGRGETKN